MLNLLNYNVGCMIKFRVVRLDIKRVIKRNYGCLLILILFCFKIPAQQNLVPNPSFENYVECPTSSGQVDFLENWYNAGRSPDFFHFCGTPTPPNVFFGYQLPRTELGFVGQLFVGGGSGNPDDFHPEYEYIGVQLTEPLVGGLTYEVEFYVSLTWRAEWGTDCIELLFSEAPIYLDFPSEIFIDTQAQVISSEIVLDTVDWTRIHGEYTALGGESYITLGCFKDNSVVQIGETGWDSTINHFNTYYFIDDVSVQLKITSEAPCGNLFIPSIFSPNDDGINDNFSALGDCFESYHLRIYNRWGEKVFESNNQSLAWDGTFKGKNLNTGIYVYHLHGLYNGEEIHKTGTVQLVR
jgi:gliding motility-associated-like protein